MPRCLTREDIIQVLGQVPDARAASILATGATVEELEEAAAWAAGESDVMGKLQRPASPIVGAVYDILTAEEKFPDARD
jgi:hypothetical protein